MDIQIIWGSCCNQCSDSVGLVGPEILHLEQVLRWRPSCRSQDNILKTRDQEEKASLEGAENPGGRRETQMVSVAELDRRNQGSGKRKWRKKTEID